jgi:hypothetical protein
MAQNYLLSGCLCNKARWHHRKPIYFAHAYSNGIQFLKRCAALGLSFLWASPAGIASFSSFFGF